MTLLLFFSDILSEVLTFETNLKTGWKFAVKLPILGFFVFVLYYFHFIAFTVDFNYFLRVTLIVYDFFS